MEQPLSSLVFNGSIIEAITAAKHQKKLFVVYVSGGMESNQLETSIWLNPKVVDCISKYCILLHILEGSMDAGNFSALYPQKATPCITAIGYNGVQLWQHEGFVSTDELASNLEKAWLSLHAQETTATFLAAALASKEVPVYGDSSVASEAESSSSVTLDNNSQIVEEGVDHGHAATEIEPLVIDAASHEFNDSTPPITIEERPLDLVEVDATKTKAQIVEDLGHADTEIEPLVVDAASRGEFNDSTPPIVIEERPLDLAAVDSAEIKDEPYLCDQGMDPNEEAPGEISNEARKGPEINIVEDATAEKTDFSDSSSNTSQNVSLNVRLPDGSSLQVKLLVTDTLRMVKDFVDKEASIIGSYDLAVPYPRKVFGDEDLDRKLSDLGLHNRQALIIVFRNKVRSTSLHGQSNEGYFAVIRRLFSFVNPFSYLGGSSNTSNTAQDSQDSMRQHGSNPRPQNNQNLAGRPYKTPTTTTSDSSRSPASARFGSNIHGLKRDEDDKQFGDKNTFWNGNSTQFGGDDDSK